MAPPPSVPSPTPEPASETPQATRTTGGSNTVASGDGKGEPHAPKHEATAGAKHTGNSLYDLAKRGEATLPTTAPAASPTPTPTPPPVAPPAPVPSAPAPAPSAPKGKVTIPSTEHVRVDVPAGLQAALDADPRMQPWANKVISVIDGCYAGERNSNKSAAGTISVLVTMHSESRPDADIKSLPSALSGVVACATGGLMRTKMPLFTGKEGEKHTLNIRFTQ
ncbi:MAG: hypothetical protein QM778_12860 [Myxococcales bacterium]